MRPPSSQTYASAAGRNGRRCSSVAVRAPVTSTCAAAYMHGILLHFQLREHPGTLTTQQQPQAAGDARCRPVQALSCPSPPTAAALFGPAVPCGMPDKRNCERATLTQHNTNSTPDADVAHQAHHLTRLDMNEAATLTALTMLHSQPDDSHMTHYASPSKWCASKHNR